MLTILKLGGTLPAEAQALCKGVVSALSDPRVTVAIIDLDCNGGPCLPAYDQLIETIHEISRKKMVIGYANPRALSGGLALAGACTKFIAHPDAEIGSLKVRALFAEDGAAIEGVVAGQYTIEGHEKRVRLHDAAEEENLRYVARLLHQALIARLARHRGLTFDEVRSRYGTGEVFGAAEALRRGAIDAVMTWPQLVQRVQKIG